MKLKINEFFLFLLQKKNFYGRMAASLHRVAKPGLGTMAVGVFNGRVSLFYDPEFVDSITMGAAMFVLEHEMLHLVLDHIPRYHELLSHCTSDDEKVKAKHVYNIAMDCAINSLLRQHKHFAEAEEFTKRLSLKMYEAHLAKEAKEREKRVAAGEQVEAVSEDDKPDLDKAGMCLPEKYDLPDLRSFEWYQRELMKRVKVIRFDLGFGGSGSCHDMWDDSMGGSATSDSRSGQANRLREQLKRLLRAAVKSTGGIGRGLLPAGVEEFLGDYLADPIVPWWEVFVTRAKTSKAAKFRRSVTVPNRSLMALAEEDPSIIPFPGRLRDKSWRVFLMVDTSGSMSTESLVIAKSELQHMLTADEGMEIRYLEGDAAVHRDIVLRPGDGIPGDVIGRGGTDFDAYFEHMARYVHDDSTRPDIVIVYTDGYCPAVAPKNRLPADIPVIWLVTPNYSKNTLDGYGEIIVCDPDHNDLHGR